MNRQSIRIQLLCLVITMILTPHISQAAREQLQEPRLVTYKTVGDVILKLHIFDPPGHKPTDKRPAIVFFFGGGWVGGNARQFYDQCRYLASRGMVAVSAEYRVKTVHGVDPRECVKDSKSAIRWIRLHADELGVDPHKVAAGGGSAGGHIATAAGTATAFEEEAEDKSVSSWPDALVLYNPVIDNGPGGYGHETVQDYWQQFSPMHNITDKTPPTFVSLGTKDKFVPVATAEKFKALMEAKGRRCELLLFEGGVHGFFNKQKSFQHGYERNLIATDRFLASLGYLEGEPTMVVPEEVKPERKETSK